MLLVGDRAHGLLLRLNRWFNAWRRLRRKPYWSLAAWVKSRIGKARSFIRRFELAALTAAERGHYDGFICGHIHSAGFLRSQEGLYCNDGDWVEHCTALVERHDGKLDILHWSEQPGILASSQHSPPLNSAAASAPSSTFCRLRLSKASMRRQNSGFSGHKKAPGVRGKKVCYHNKRSNLKSFCQSRVNF